jgi:class 3 adenylate cyclase/putative methionine-R-sulfoxide reductase with GAF domain
MAGAGRRELGGAADLERELAESRARESALGAVLGIMRRAPDDVVAVLESVAMNAVRLCAADNGSIAQLKSDGWRLVANVGDMDRDKIERNWGNQPIEANRRSLTGRVLMDRRTTTIVDAQADPEYDAGSGVFNVRSLIGVPLMRGEDIVGVLILRREEPTPFTPEQIHLLETFADQASIAIENARLFNDTKDALDRQTAIGDVLRTIGSAAFDLELILEEVAKHAARLCKAENVVIFRTFGNTYRLAAGPVPANPDFDRIVGANPQPIGLDTIVGRSHLEARPIQVADAVDYYRNATGSAAELARVRKVRTLLAVPLIRDGIVLGVISLTRSTVHPFTAEAVDLVSTFADQAAIAIANVELFQTVERQRQELSRFLSPQVADLVTSEDGAKLLEGHRRQITVVFCDLRNFTAFAESAEPEEVLGVLRDYHRAMGELIVEHRGTLEHFAGDGMMVFFNDPLPVERHELQAVGMACAMRDRFDQMARGWQKRGYELGFGVGIATGYATLGRIGFEGRYDYGAIGNVVILAQRLSAEAKAGQILLSQRVHAAVEADAETTSIGDLALKGFTRPVPAFAADSVRAKARAVSPK